MQPYLIEIWPPAQKYLKKIRKKDKSLYERYRNAIEDISKNPYIGKAKTGDLSGMYSYDIHHQGVYYELAYRIREYENEDLTIIIIMLCGPRENFYNELKRYLKTRSKTF